MGSPIHYSVPKIIYCMVYLKGEGTPLNKYRMQTTYNMTINNFRVSILLLVLFRIY